MALRPILDSLDAIPEALRSEYELVDGKYHLAVDLADDMPWKPVRKLTGALTQERSGRSEESRARAELLREKTQLTAKIAELEAAQAAKGGDVEQNAAFQQFRQAQEERVKQLEDRVKAETEKREQAEQMRDEARWLEEVRREAAPFVSDAPGVLDAFVELKVKPHFKRDQQGAFIPYDGDAIVYSTQNAGKPMDTKEFIAERAIRDQTAAFMLRQSRGAGATGSGPGTPNGSRFTIPRGAPFAEYVRVKTEAEKAGQTVQVIEP